MVLKYVFVTIFGCLINNPLHLFFFIGFSNTCSTSFCMHCFRSILYLKKYILNFLILSKILFERNDEFQNEIKELNIIHRWYRFCFWFSYFVIFVCELLFFTIIHNLANCLAILLHSNIYIFLILLYLICYW